MTVSTSNEGQCCDVVIRILQERHEAQREIRSLDTAQSWRIEVNAPSSASEGRRSQWSVDGDCVLILGAIAQPLERFQTRSRPVVP